MEPTTAGAGAVLDRLIDATNRHDLEALVDCFAAGYRNETPAHPARDFQGSGQVRRNWEQIFAAVPDVRARVLRRIVDGDTIWSEWEMGGTRRDGSPHLMRGVILFTVHNECIASARFYLEPVETGGGNVDDAVRRTVVRPPVSGA